MTGRPTPSIALLAAVGLFPAVLAAAGLLVALAGALAFHPLWPGSTDNLAEAAYLGDAAAVAIILERGADPNRAVHVPAGGPIADRPANVPPLEAAIRNGDVHIVKLLVSAGASLEGSRGTRAACLARLRDAPQIVEYVESRGVRPDDDDCRGIDFDW